MKISAILAMTPSGLIGVRNKLPWNIPEDMKRFRDLTLGNIVVMGKNTYFSLPDSYRPLPKRRNIVLSSENIPGIECYSSLDILFSALEKEEVPELFVIGGAQIYNLFFQKKLIENVYLTLVPDGDYDQGSDGIFVGEFRDDFTLINEEIQKNCTFQFLHKKPISPRGLDF